MYPGRRNACSLEAKCQAALGTSTMKRLLIGSVFILTISLLASTATVSAQSCAAFGASVASDAKSGVVGAFVSSVATSGARALADLAAAEHDLYCGA